jgi:shikimate dehydrogenase
VPIDSGGLINATPMGMPGVQPAMPDIGRMPAGGWVFDMVTDPAETALLRAARERGLVAIDGLSMLVEQAAESFMLLFGQDAPRKLDAELMARLRA